MATLAPSAASLFAIAAPMPREPPVTSATFLFNLVTFFSFGFLMCDRRHEISHSVEYQPFPAGMHSAEEEISHTKSIGRTLFRETRASGDWDPVPKSPLWRSSWRNS